MVEDGTKPDGVATSGWRVIRVEVVYCRLAVVCRRLSLETKGAFETVETKETFGTP